MPDDVDDRRSRVCALTSLRPLHDLPSRERRRLGVLRARGRPRKIEIADAAVYNEEIERQRLEWIAADAVVRAECNRLTPPDERLRAVEGALAHEAAALAVDGLRVRQRGGDASTISSRRIDALVKLAACVLARARMFEADVTPGVVARLRGLFVETVTAVASETLPPEIARTLLATLDINSSDDVSDASVRKVGYPSDPCSS